MTHQAPADWVNTDTRFTFVTNGVESAIEQAKAIAERQNVGVGPGSTVGQALRAGLIDEVRVDLVPVTLGSGRRMLEGLTDDPCGFGDPQVIQGVGVTHLIYPMG